MNLFQLTEHIRSNEAAIELFANVVSWGHLTIHHYVQNVDMIWWYHLVMTFYQLFVSFSHLSKSLHFHGKSWHILVQMPLIGKIISDSCSPAKNNPKNGFSEKNWSPSPSWLPFIFIRFEASKSGQIWEIRTVGSPVLGWLFRLYCSLGVQSTFGSPIKLFDLTPKLQYSH